MKKTIVFDFDGVIHSYTSGWQGAATIPDPPTPGIIEALQEICEAGYEIVIVSSRCATEEGKTAIQDYLTKHHMHQYVSRICTEKPPAIVYIDDRAICFDGNASNLLEKIQAFRPWYQKESTFRGWNDAKSILPAPGEIVLGYCQKTNKMFVGYADESYRGKAYWTHIGASGALYSVKSKVTHWMPLPTPPSGD